MMANRPWHWALLATLLAAVASSGCTSVGGKGLGGLLGQNDPPSPEPSATYQVLFVPHEGKPEQVVRTLSGTMHVQQALEQTGGFKKFRRIDVELVRPLPSGGYHKIACDYDRSTKHITPEFDYALLPGDRIVVKEDPSTIVDDMLTSSLGPIGSKILNRARGREPKESRYQIQR